MSVENNLPMVPYDATFAEKQKEAFRLTGITVPFRARIPKNPEETQQVSGLLKIFDDKANTSFENVKKANQSFSQRAITVISNIAKAIAAPFVFIAKKIAQLVKAIIGLFKSKKVEKSTTDQLLTSLPSMISVTLNTKKAEETAQKSQIDQLLTSLPAMSKVASKNNDQAQKTATVSEKKIVSDISEENVIGDVDAPRMTRSAARKVVQQ